jgi:Arc/MetJ-type ribon-helix-helix transcriptional regulator
MVDRGRREVEHVCVTLTLSARAEASIQRLVASGKFRSPPEAIEAGLEKLVQENQALQRIEKFPPGSLAHLFTKDQNAEELTLLKGSSLLVSDE